MQERNAPHYTVFWVLPLHSLHYSMLCSYYTAYFGYCHYTGLDVLAHLQRLPSLFIFGCKSCMSSIKHEKTRTLPFYIGSTIPMDNEKFFLNVDNNNDNNKHLAAATTRPNLSTVLRCHSFFLMHEAKSTTNLVDSPTQPSQSLRIKFKAPGHTVPLVHFRALNTMPAKGLT